MGGGKGAKGKGKGKPAKLEESKKEEDKKEEEEEKKPEDDIPEELKPVVAKLKDLDDKWLELEKEYNKKVTELMKEYSLKQKPFLEERAKVIADPEQGAKEAGQATPAVPGFWLKALQNSNLSDDIQEYDEEPLSYLRDIRTEYLDDDDTDKGFRLTFEFAENPFFTNTTLTRTYHTREENVWRGDIAVEKIVGTPIEWKSGKDVTVEVTTKKTKGGGAKKAKQKGKQQVQPRPSFFRNLSRELVEDGEVPEDVEFEEDDDDEFDVMEMLMDDDHEKGTVLRDSIIPHAVRWYTGEAAPEDEDDDENEESEEEDGELDDDDDDDDESEEEDAGRGKAKGKAKSKAKAKEKGDSKGDGEQGKNPEECKQQ